MLTSLNDVIQRIIAGYDPDRIILFGSRASGTGNRESDFDLLIVKETASRPVERRIELERLLIDRRIALDLFVYTPAEVRRLYAGGSPLIEEVVHTGKVLYMRKTTEAWLAEAREDFESAAILLDHRKHRGACLHSQQCVEKALKALLLEKGRRPARTHDIVELVNAVRAEGWTIDMEMDDAVYLNSIYRGRYPTEEGLLPHGEPEEQDARHAVNAADMLLKQTERLLLKG
jgi:HEPN domain-containing protein/predicted nucleotidyltransferase